MKRTYCFKAHEKMTLIIFVLTVLSSCSVTQSTLKSNLKLPESYNDQKEDTLNIGKSNWRTFFSDSCLCDLIDTALVRNYDLKIATQRIEIANTGYTMNKWSSMPSFQINGFTGKDRSFPKDSPSISNSGINVSSSWEVDLWGKLHNLKKAGKARLLASHEGKQLVQTNLIAAIAGTYYELLAFDAELDIIDNNIRLQNIALDIVKVQKQAGKATNLAVLQFEAQLLDTKAKRNDIQRMIIESEQRINLLLNRLPQKIKRGNISGGQDFPVRLQTGIPAHLLLNRPDIKEALLALDAAGFNVHSARKAFYPVISFGTSSGYATPSVFPTINLRNAVWSLAANLTAPIFQQYKIKGNLRIAEAEHRQASLYYEQLVIKSITEVSTNLELLHEIDLALDFRNKETEVLRNAVSTSNDLFALGYATYLEVISSQKNARDAEVALIEIQRDKYLKTIDLYRALGGGGH